MNSTHSVNSSIIEFESRSEKVLTDFCSARVIVKELALCANSTRASSVAYLFFESIMLVFYTQEVLVAQ